MQVSPIKSMEFTFFFGRKLKPTISVNFPKIDWTILRSSEFSLEEGKVTEWTIVEFIKHVEFWKVSELKSKPQIFLCTPFPNEVSLKQTDDSMYPFLGTWSIVLLIPKGDDIPSWSLYWSHLSLNTWNVILKPKKVGFRDFICFTFLPPKITVSRRTKWRKPS